MDNERHWHNRAQYIKQRREDILEAVSELSPEALSQWNYAALRLTEKAPDFSFENALELLVTIYATDGIIPCFDLPP